MKYKCIEPFTETVYDEYDDEEIGELEIKRGDIWQLRQVPANGYWIVLGKDSESYIEISKKMLEEYFEECENG